MGVYLNEKRVARVITIGVDAIPPNTIISVSSLEIDRGCSLSQAQTKGNK